MNLDEFEKKLGSHPMREIPAEWRAEILGAARLAEKSPAEWREWLWPSPMAWAGLAAVWVVILGLNLAAHGGSARPAVFAFSRQELKELKQQRLTLARMAAPGETAETSKPEPASTPRSERRKTEFGV